MKAEKIIRLRIQNSAFCRRIRVVQGDTGRIFRFILEDITMDGSEQARVYAKKPDGTEVYNDCEVVSPNEVLMESDSGQIFAAIGVVQAEIQISKLGKTITTYTFEFDVEISLTRAGAIQSSSEYGALEAAIAKAEGFYNPTFAEAKTRDNINSGESIPTLFGKVKKWFTDLNTLIKLVGSTDISGIGNGTVTDALSVLNSKPLKYLSQPENIPDGMNIDLFSVSCGKSGKNITIAFNVRGSIEITKTFLTLITLPKEYVPSRNLYESYITQDGYTMLLGILSTGEVQVYSNSAIKSAFFLRKIISY